MPNTIDSISAPATVAILTADSFLRIGLESLLNMRNHTRLVSHAVDVFTCEEFIRRETPQIVIIDTEADTPVAGLIRHIRIAGPTTKIILLSGFKGLDRTKDAHLSEVDGLVLKVQPVSVLTGMIEFMISRASDTVATTLREHSRFTAETDHHDAPSGLDALTKREREVIAGLGQGLTNKQIAERLCLSEITVRHHLTTIYDKLGVKNRQKLVIRAYQCGLIELTVPAA